MPVYDITHEAEAVEPPVLKIGRLTYVGRVLSEEEWFPWEAKLRRAHSKAKKVADNPEDGNENAIPAVVIEVRDTIRQYVDTIFPRRWQIWRKRASYWVLRLPPERMAALLEGFLKSQGKALGLV